MFLFSCKRRLANRLQRDRKKSFHLDRGNSSIRVKLNFYCKVAHDSAFGFTGSICTRTLERIWENKATLTRC